MATKFVSVARGSDSTGDGSASNPWKTINKAVGSGSAFMLDTGAANTLYVEPGIYRETIVVGVSPSSSGPLAIVGDCDGAGFTAGGYSSAATGLVDWRAWSDDHTALTAPCIQAGTNTSFVTVEHVKFIAGDTGSGAAYVSSGTNWTFVDCDVIGHYGLSRGNLIRAAVVAGVNLNLVVDRCTFNAYSTGGMVTVTADTASADWNLGVVIRNCLMRGPGYGVQISAGAAGGAKLAGGVAVQNCTIITGNYGAYVYNGQTYVPPSPVVMNGCVLIIASLRAGALGQLVEDGNLVLNTSEHTNVSHGSNSVYGACPAFDLGDGRLTGQALAPLFTPSAVGPAVGFGNFGTTPSVDLWDLPRPATASAGALEIDVIGGGGGGGGGAVAGTVNLGVAMSYLGDYGRGQEVVAPFGTASTLADGTAKVLRDDDVSSTAGVVVAVDRGAATGLNAVKVDTGADAAFYVDNHDYEIWMTAGTVGSDSAAGLIGSFSIRNRPAETKAVAFDTSGIKSVGG